MAHVQLELVRDRHRTMLAAAAAEREGRQALHYRRVARQARRAERRQLDQADQVMRLRARLSQLESAR
jgi:hypothetical protein